MSKKKRFQKIFTGSFALALSIPLVAPTFSSAASIPPKQNFHDAQQVHKNAGQPVIEAAEKNILKIKGKKYKDLNGNNKLDPYENWQLPVSQRVKDLVSKMTLEEKAGLMLISETRMNEQAAAGQSLLIEDDKWDTTNAFAKPGDPNYEFKEPVLTRSAATKGILERNLRYLIIRQTPSADKMSEWTNQLQKVAESSRLGIPVMITTNPVNHIKNSQMFGLDNTTGGPTAFPGEIGLGATNDPKLVKEFAETSKKELASAGVRKIYGYMADVTTDPLWGRAQDTFGENPERVSKMITSLVEGFQGEELNKDSVSLTIKHFPGGGAREDGKDPHYLNGQYNPYPTEGSLYKYHLPAFKAAIDAGTTAIMPYYAYPSNEASVPQLKNGTEAFEEVGFAFNKAIIDGLLRKELGFKGYVNSDTGIISAMPWGVENLTLEERYAKAIDAGTNLFGGDGNPEHLIKAVKDGLVDEKDLDQSVTYLLTEMMNLGLFEDPYTNPEHALKVVSNPASQKLADKAHRESIVLLRNDEKTLPLNDEKIKNVKLYVQVLGGGDSKGYGQAEGADEVNTAGLKNIIKKYDPSITITDNIEEATHAFVWVIPTAAMVTPTLTIGEETKVNVAKVKEIENKVPTILALNMTNPWLINEIEPGAAAVISTFDVKSEAVIDVLRGRYNPTGKLPVTIPADQKAVDNEAGDVPGYAEKDPNYTYVNKHGDKYVSGFGLSYKKQDKNANAITFSDTDHDNN